MSIARVEQDKDKRWWLRSQAFPNTVHECKSLGEADRIKDALNTAYEMGKQNKREEIFEARMAYEELLRPPYDGGEEGEP